nr:hypothetical protein [uncultured Devosia sp.]
MSAMIGIAIGLAAARMTLPWQEPGAILDLDFVNERYFWDGRHFATRAAFLAAIGGTITNGAVTFPWTDPTVQIRVDALIAEEPLGDEVLYAIDDGSEANCLRVRRDGASQVVRIFATAQGTTLSDIGTLTIGRGAVLRTSQSVRLQNFAGAANGIGGDATITSSALPNVTTMRIGRGPVADLPWSGQVRRVTVMPEPAVDLTANTKSSLPPYDLWLEGDSYVDGAPSFGLAASLSRLGGHYPLNDAIGGSTLAQAQARILARAEIRANLPLVYWDGDNNGFAPLADDLARYAAIANALGHGRFLFIAPALRSGQPTDQRQAALALTNALRATYGDRLVDPMPALLALANGPGDAGNVASGTVPASLLLDGVHLNRTGLDAVAQLVMQRLTEKGWR